MKITAISSSHRIALNESESRLFRKKLPSSRDIEALVEKIEEEGTTISVFDEDEATEFEVECNFESFPFFGDVKREVHRIESELKKFLNDDQL